MAQWSETLLGAPVGCRIDKAGTRMSRGLDSSIYRFQIANIRSRFVAEAIFGLAFHIGDRLGISVLTGGLLRKVAASTSDILQILIIALH